MEYNPWNVRSIQEFMFYCCPECDSQIKTAQDFIKHALKVHEHAKDSLCMKNELIDTKNKLGQGPVTISILKRKGDEVPGSSPDSKVQKLESIIEDPNQEEYKDDSNDDQTEMSDDQEVFLCSSCDEVCLSKSCLLQHMKDEHDQVQDSSNSTKCHVCNKSYSTKHTLKFHMQNVHHIFEETPVAIPKDTKPDIPETQYGKVNDLDSEDSLGQDPNWMHHVAVNQKAKKQTKKAKISRNRCRICRIQFKNILEYKEHIENTHKSNDGYNCNICQIVLLSKSLWMHHVAVKHKEKIQTGDDIDQTKIPAFYTETQDGKVKAIVVMDTERNCEKLLKDTMDHNDEIEKNPWMKEAMILMWTY